MTSFYAAHVREPVFVASTKLWLPLVDHQTSRSVSPPRCSRPLRCGRPTSSAAYAYSRWIGLLAAIALAIEHDVIGWAAEGWRDDAMMFVFVMSCYAFLRCVRAPTVANAILAGVIAGIACLTRITALSFLLPAIAYLAWTRDVQRHEQRHVQAGVPPPSSLAVMTAIVAPYMINCAIAFGDPFYAINSHTTFYRARAQSGVRSADVGRRVSWVAAGSAILSASSGRSRRA